MSSHRPDGIEQTGTTTIGTAITTMHYYLLLSFRCVPLTTLDLLCASYCLVSTTYYLLSAYIQLILIWTLVRRSYDVQVSGE